MIQEPSKRFMLELSLPLINADTVELVKDVLSVDTEHKKGEVVRDMCADESNLKITLAATDLKSLRVSVNSILKNVTLILETIKQFSIESK